MQKVRNFLARTPFVRYLALTVVAVVLLAKAGLWAKHRVETYAYEVLLPRVMQQAQAAVKDGIRNGVNGAASDLTGGLLGKPDALQTDGPCVVRSQPRPASPFGIPFGLPNVR